MQFALCVFLFIHFFHKPADIDNRPFMDTAAYHTALITRFNLKSQKFSVRIDFYQFGMDEHLHSFGGCIKMPYIHMCTDRCLSLVQIRHHAARCRIFHSSNHSRCRKYLHRSPAHRSCEHFLCNDKADIALNSYFHNRLQHIRVTVSKSI